jgi:hypothetical protein
MKTKKNVLLVTLVIAASIVLFFSRASQKNLPHQVKFEVSASSSSYRGAASLPSVEISTAHASSSSKSYSVWNVQPVVQSDLEKIGSLIGYGNDQAAFQFIKVNQENLDQIKEGDVFEVPLPDAVAVDAHVTKVENNAAGRSIVGHLSGYPEPYYIGFSYDAQGNIYGEITTEKTRYSVKTYAGKTVVFKILPEMSKKSINDVSEPTEENVNAD